MKLLILMLFGFGLYASPDAYYMAGEEALREGRYNDALYNFAEAWCEYRKAGDLERQANSQLHVGIALQRLAQNGNTVTDREVWLTGKLVEKLEVRVNHLSYWLVTIGFVVSLLATFTLWFYYRQRLVNLETCKKITGEYIDNIAQCLDHIEKGEKEALGLAKEILQDMRH